MKAPTEEQLLEACAVLERIIGETNVADGITTAEKEQGWRRVIDELIQLSVKDARRMGEGCVVNKGSYTLPPDQWVHARVIAMILDLSAWMGMQWESHSLGRKKDFLQLLERAYEAGEALESRRKRSSP
jgi:hypothetical protein